MIVYSDVIKTSSADEPLAFAPNDEIISDGYTLIPCNADEIDALAKKPAKTVGDVLGVDDEWERQPADVKAKKEAESILYFVRGERVTEAAANVDTGANASAEGGDDEGAEDTAKEVINVVSSGLLESTSFDKKSYMAYLKGYLKSTKQYIPWAQKNREENDWQWKALSAEEQEAEKKKVEQQIAIFEPKAMAFAKWIQANFKDLDFYTGASMNPDGMVILSNYMEDGVSPYFLFWKAGLKGQKC
ncbi:hypothetical protein QC762_710110 [Podospora pseudocomata]|uniref:Translationally-controlled tumor protein homolog n=1 Tax=Podospora pseudocomata TaxID=2093779 RepID=A0ABR0G4R6_9PEZI|nr:hypothetical protein QC762_710110 [Podospora pseudocomata]